MRERAARLVRHPLLHFALIGAALFALHAWRNPSDAARSRSVAVDAAQIRWLADTFEVQFGHRPTPHELRSTVDSFVDDELRYREALAMGLDRDDSVVRRRLIQKYDFLAADDAPREATEDELRRWWQAHPTRFLAPPRVSVCQVYVAPEPSRDMALARARAILARLQRSDATAPGEGDRQGDPIDLPACYTDASADDIARDFGQFFATTIGRVPQGGWVGPVESGLGFHAVRVTARRAATPRPFAAARADVAADWRRATQLAERDRRAAALRARYEVTIDRRALEAAAR